MINGKLKTNLKVISCIFAFLVLVIAIVLALAAFAYLRLLPQFVKSEKFSSLLKTEVKTALNLDFEINKPVLKTYLRPRVDFSVQNLVLKQGNKTLICLDNFSTSLEFENFKKILDKKIKLNYLLADELTVYLDKLLEILPQAETSEPQEFELPIDINLYNSDIKLNNLTLSYLMNKTLVLIDANDIKILQNPEDKDIKTLDFISNITVSKDVSNAGKNAKKTYLDILITAQNDVKLLKNSIKTDNLEILVNNSVLKLTSTLDNKAFKLRAKSNKFFLEDVFKIVQSDIVIPDGETLLAPLTEPKGLIAYDIDMLINLKDFIPKINGEVLINNTKAKIKDLAQLPLNVERGKLLINPQSVDFIGLEGYYGKTKRKDNPLKIYGSIKDYYKSLDSDITIDTRITNEFFRDYLAKLINNTVIYTSKPIGTRIIYKSKYNIMDIVWLAKVNKGVNFGLYDDFSENSTNALATALSAYDRAIKGDFHIEGDKLDIKNINYYIASDIHKGVKIKPILTIDGRMDLLGNIENIGFNFDREMPAEFLNIFARQRLFKKGTIKGALHIAFKNNSNGKSAPVPVLVSDMELKDTFIPSQRLKIKTAQLKTDNNFINIITEGRFKRVNFDFKGKIKNALVAPFTIKDLSLALDEVDVERFLNSLNSQNGGQNNGQNNGQNIQNGKQNGQDTVQNSDKNIQHVSDVKTASVSQTDDIIDDNFMFDTNLVRIENGKFSLKKGNYKELQFGNINADITLDEKGILKIQSNKFDIAEGISTLRVICDLSKLEYYLRLGVKEVNSDLMARVLFNLEREISGKASGLVEINSDKSMKLNGTVKFLINDGTIGKIGLVEYVLKIASVFRNPAVMISPATIMDIISIPEGKFSKISGEMKIKDNVVKNIFIQSYSSYLSALIRGRFDMDQHDASLRIYTRFSSSKNSTFAFLRNMSLNALANKMQLSSRNDANYYSSELKDLPQIDVDESRAQIFLTQVEGDVEHNNFLSTLKKIK